MSLHVNPLTSEGKIRVENILQQAAKDIKFRELLTENPKEALKDSGLTEEEISVGEFKHEVRQFQKPYDNQQAEQISLMV
ncbi:hypothetical protein [Acinetobacter baumannii]|uniref:hypothetical protein n=1 Tax=Acinetobacter baumannii TaxID=470 RepID=UPI00209F65E8|nr:hypothetical protein [Acinetobacter baumannii]UTA09834.1 hypothetical protein KQ257_17885 [Acinetobacter baumannii]